MIRGEGGQKLMGVDKGEMGGLDPHKKRDITYEQPLIYKHIDSFL